MNSEVLETYGQKQLDEIKYWVYVLDCYDRFRCDDYQELKRRAEKRIGYEPDWLRMAWEHRRQYYVGQTENLQKRLGQHFKNKSSSKFTEIFEPQSIVLLYPCGSRSHAENEEKSIARGYYDSNNIFAYYK